MLFNVMCAGTTARGDGAELASLPAHIPYVMRRQMALQAWLVPYMQEIRMKAKKTHGSKTENL
jgi:hypothetical protein